MKKLFYLIAVACVGALISSCSDDEGTYGDLSIVPEMQLAGFSSKADPTQTYAMTVDQSAPTDSTFENGRVVPMTVYHVAEVPCVLDTFELGLLSNARWIASTQARSGFQLITLGGSGNATVRFRVTNNTSKTKARVNNAIFITRDSSRICKMIIKQLPKSE